MHFRSIVTSAALTLLVVAGSAFAQNAKPQKTDTMNSTKAVASKDDSTAKPQISAKDLKARLDKGEKVIIIDARHNVNGEMLKGAVHVTSDGLAEWAKNVDKKTVIVTYCTCPHDEAAEEEVRELRKMGFEQAYALTGGMSAARTAGIEVTQSKE